MRCPLPRRLHPLSQHSRPVALPERHPIRRWRAHRRHDAGHRLREGQEELLPSLDPALILRQGGELLLPEVEEAAGQLVGLGVGHAERIAVLVMRW